MSRRIISTLILLLGSSAPRLEAQTRVPCANELSPQEFEQYRRRLAAQGPPNSFFGAQTHRAPIAFHIIRSGTGTGGLDPATLEHNLADANAAFAGTQIEFFAGPVVDFIDSDEYFDGVETGITNTPHIQDEVWQMMLEHETAHAIDVYFVPLLLHGPLHTGQIAGLGTLPGYLVSGTPVNGIVVANGASWSAGDHTTFPHELGHYFDLLHTHEGAGSATEECPDGSNCDSTGDLICDTAAAPDMRRQVDEASCTYTGTGTACGQPYDPDPTNFMSYAPASCRSLFTPMQVGRMRSALLNTRLNEFAIWVNFDAHGQKDGTYQHPFKELEDALDVAPPGGRIVIQSAGSTSELLQVNQPVTLEVLAGPAHIGG